MENRPNLKTLSNPSSEITIDKLYEKIRDCLAYQHKFLFVQTSLDRSIEKFSIDVNNINRIYHVKVWGKTTKIFKLIARLLIHGHFMYIYMDVEFKYDNEKRTWERNGTIYYNRNGRKFLNVLKKDKYLQRAEPSLLSALENIQEFVN